MPNLINKAIGIIDEMIVRPILAVILKYVWIERFNGVENIPRNRGAVIVSNHASYFDFFAIAYVGYIMKRKICFLAAKELFSHPIIGWFIRHDKNLSTIYMDRCNPGVKYFKKAIQMLKAGNLLVIFPEGTRSHDRIIHEGKSGFVKLATQAKVPIVPMGLQGTFDILPKGSKLLRLRKCGVSIGRPILMKRYLNQKIDKVDSRKTVECVMWSISKLANGKLEGIE